VRTQKTRQNGDNTTVEPIKIPPVDSTTTAIFPEWIRLPKAGQLCRWCGLSRGALNALILPQAANGFCPPVKSFCIRQRGAKSGIRLISYDSLRSHILSQESGRESVCAA
jgi:hypothetical protein